MNRKRALISDTFKVKKRRVFTEKFGATNNNGKKEIGSLKFYFTSHCCYADLYSFLDGPMDIKSTLLDLMTLFPRKIFNDTLPQIVLKHQLYSIHDDKTIVDRQLVILRSPSPPPPTSTNTKKIETLFYLSSSTERTSGKGRAFDVSTGL